MIGTSVSAKMMATLAFRSVAKRSTARRSMRFILTAVVAAAALSLKSTEEIAGVRCRRSPITGGIWRWLR